MSDSTKKSKNRKGRIILKNLTKEQRQNVLSTGGGALAGVAGQMGVMSLMSFVSSSETQAAEPDSIEVSDEQAVVEPVVVYTEAPFADSVTDDMSFNEAFTAARSEVGAGGIFEWKGNSYNTYTKEEFDSMSEEEVGNYVDSIEGQVISVEETTEAEITNESEIMTGEYIDIDGDGVDDAVYVDVDGNEELDLMVDTDGDGVTDDLIYNVSEEDLEELENEMNDDDGEVVVDEDDFEDVDFDYDDTTIASNDSEDIIDTEDWSDLDASYDIDNDVDMSDFV